MDTNHTHEHELPDDQLPGHGVFDTEFIREQLREGEQAGILLWDEDAGTYRESARAVVGKIAGALMATAAMIDPDAGPDRIMEAVGEAVAGAVGWQVQTSTVQVDADADDDAPMPDPDADVPDTFPEGWTA